VGAGVAQVGAGVAQVGAGLAFFAFFAQVGAGVAQRKRRLKKRRISSVVPAWVLIALALCVMLSRKWFPSTGRKRRFIPSSKPIIPPSFAGRLKRCPEHSRWVPCPRVDGAAAAANETHRVLTSESNVCFSLYTYLYLKVNAS